MSIVISKSTQWGEAQRQMLQRILQRLDPAQQAALMARPEMVALLPHRVRAMHLHRIRRELQKVEQDVRAKQRPCRCGRCQCSACQAKHARCRHLRFPHYYVRNGISYECYLEAKAVDLELKDDLMRLENRPLRIGSVTVR